MSTPFFNTDEFTRRLTKEVGQEDLARQMLLLQCRYEYCIGIVDEGEWEKFFETKSQAHEFKKKHNLELTVRSYDPPTVEKIIMDELEVTKDVAEKFTACEEAYSKEIGIM